MLVVAAPSPARGQVPAHVEVIPTVGYFDLRGDADSGLFVNEDALAYQLRVGLVFSGNWGIEGYGGIIPSHFGKELGERHSTTSYVLGGTGTYRFANESSFTPFVVAGAEIMDLDASDGEAEANPSLVYGAGLQLSTSRKLALRLEARGHHAQVTGRSGDGDLWLDHFEYSLGLVWRPWD